MKQCNALFIEDVERAITNRLVGNSSNVGYNDPRSILNPKPLWLRLAKGKLIFLNSLISGSS